MNENDVLKAVCDIYGMEVSKAVTPVRRASGTLLDVQVICSALLRHELPTKYVGIRKMTHKEISEMFNKSNHSAICHFMTLYHNLMETNKYFRGQVSFILSKIDIQNENNQN